MVVACLVHEVLEHFVQVILLRFNLGSPGVNCIAEKIRNTYFSETFAVSWISISERVHKEH